MRKTKKNHNVASKAKQALKLSATNSQRNNGFAYEYGEKYYVNINKSMCA